MFNLDWVHARKAAKLSLSYKVLTLALELVAFSAYFALKAPSGTAAGCVQDGGLLTLYFELTSAYVLVSILGVFGVAYLGRFQPMWTALYAGLCTMPVWRNLYGEFPDAISPVFVTSQVVIFGILAAMLAVRERRIGMSQPAC